MFLEVSPQSRDTQRLVLVKSGHDPSLLAREWGLGKYFGPLRPLRKSSSHRAAVSEARTLRGMYGTSSDQCVLSYKKTCSIAPKRVIEALSEKQHKYDSTLFFPLMKYLRNQVSPSVVRSYSAISQKIGNFPKAFSF